MNRLKGMMWYGDFRPVKQKIKSQKAGVNGNEKMSEPEDKKLDVILRIGGIRSELTRRFTVRRIGVFGSFARGSADQGSDVDILVELTEPTFDNYMDLKFYLERILSRPVDLVMADAVKPRLRPIIEREVVYA